MVTAFCCQRVALVPYDREPQRSDRPVSIAEHRQRRHLRDLIYDDDNAPNVRRR